MNDTTSAESERQRIVKFLRDVYETATHGSSHLMERAIDAVEQNDMDDPARIAQPYQPSGVSSGSKLLR